MTPYAKVHNPWHDDPVHDTAIDATALNQIEGGIAAATTVADTAQSQVNSLNNIIKSGTGNPEGTITASVGTLFLRTDGSTGSSLYIKETGSGNTGWVPRGGPIAFTGTTVAGLTAQNPSDGQLGILRVGTWPNEHQELLKWRSSISKWVGDPITVITQADTSAMDLGNRSGTQLLDWSLVTNAIPYAKAFTTLNGAQAANSATLNVLAVQGHGVTFATSGTILIRDNIITYTGISGAQTSNFSFTGCTLASGTGGTIPDTIDVVQGYPGGYGFATSALSFVIDLWNAGLRLQEKMVSFMNGSPVEGVGGKALTIAPYWYEYNNGDGQIPAVFPPTGGLGFSAPLVSTTASGGAKAAERQFTWAENDWSDWAAGTPTKHFLQPRIYGKMAAGAIDTGECLDTTLRLRWIG